MEYTSHKIGDAPLGTAVTLVATLRNPDTGRVSSRTYKLTVDYSTDDSSYIITKPIMYPGSDGVMHPLSFKGLECEAGLTIEGQYYSFSLTSTDLVNRNGETIMKLRCPMSISPTNRRKTTRFTFEEEATIDQGNGSIKVTTSDISSTGMAVIYSGMLKIDMETVTSITFLYASYNKTFTVKANPVKQYFDETSGCTKLTFSFNRQQSSADLPELVDILKKREHKEKLKNTNIKRGWG